MQGQSNRDGARPKTKRAGQQEVREYSDEWVMMMVRMDLGYDTNNIYKDENDQRELNMMDEFKREEEINDRMNKA